MLPFRIAPCQFLGGQSLAPSRLQRATHHAAHPRPYLALSSSRQIPLYPGSAQSIPIRCFYALEAAVLIGELCLVDAAYSGDWSRIGLISREQEVGLQQAVMAIAVIHSIEGIISAAIASSKGLNPLIAFLKGFAFGALGI